MNGRLLSFLVSMLIITSTIGATSGVALAALSEKDATASAFILSKPLPSPKFEVTFNGLNSLFVKNVGDATATNVHARRYLQYGFIILGKDKTVRFPSIHVGETKEVRFGTIIGLGKTILTFSISCDEGVSWKYSRLVTVIGFFILVK